MSQAGLWIQCFAKWRARVLAVASTFDKHPLSGSNGWTKVTISLTPPEGTDFVVVRCVITGQGKAWFDSLSLAADAPKPVELDAIEVLDPEAFSDKPIAPQNTTATSETDDILTVSKQMQDTIRQLEKSNQELLNRITEIQTDLNRYRSNLERQNGSTPVQTPRYGSHPLIPHGYSIELDQ